MSGTPAPAPPTPPAGEPSMEDILASIRRILSDDETKPDDAAHPAPEGADDNVLVLDSTMLVQAEQPASEAAAPPPAPVPVPVPVVIPLATPSVAAPEPVEPPGTTLVAPEAAAAAASSVDALMRTLHTEQSMRVTSQGPTIEDIVRQEIRPLLKAWLDVNLPPLVERLVHTEIERVVGRVRT